MSNHIRNVGPHVHRWQTAAAVGSARFQFCEVCGARRVEGIMLGANSGQDPWLNGGEWLGEKPKSFVEPGLADESAKTASSQGRPRAVPAEIEKAKATSGAESAGASAKR